MSDFEAFPKWALVGSVVTAAAGIGVVLYGRAKAKAQGESASGGGLLDPVFSGMWPDLRVGDLVLVDSEKAKLREPFNSAPAVPAEVVIIWRDPAFVAVRLPPIATPSTMQLKQTIRREHIIRMLGRAPVVA